MERKSVVRAAFIVTALILSTLSCKSDSSLNDPYSAQDKFLIANPMVPKPNIFCLLNPDSSSQHLTIERLGGADQRMSFGSPRYTQDILFTNGTDSTYFVRHLTDPNAEWTVDQWITSPLWDHYSVADSIMDIVHGGRYSLSGIFRSSHNRSPTSPDTTILVTDPMPDIDLRGLLDDNYNLRFVVPYEGWTRVPGAFQIDSPVDGARIFWEDKLTIRWTAGPAAYGYMVLIFAAADDPLAVAQNVSALRYRLLTHEISHSLPYGFQNKFEKPLFERYGVNDYIIEIWAVDKNAFEFFLVDPKNRLIQPPSGIEPAVGMFGSTVIRRISLTISDEL